MQPLQDIKDHKKNCDLKLRVLSYHDTPSKYKDNGVIQYKRITKYRCDSGHRVHIESAVDA